MTDSQARIPIINIEVSPPTRTPTRYEFRCCIKGRPLDTAEAVRRLKTILRGYGSLVKDIIRFGYVAKNFEIRHHEVWDSVYPLMYLTRNGGPLMQAHAAIVWEKARIEFTYPILEPVRRFYVKRAADQGIDLEVQAPTYAKTFEVVTKGEALAFGGGKDSRLLLGLLNEVGYNPVVYTAGAENALDLADVKVCSPLHGVLTNRIIAALMSFPQHFYYGSGLGEVAYEKPWHNYYDMGAPQPLSEFASLMRSLGINIKLHVPASVLPYNLIQRILSQRYPELFAHQFSVPKNAPTEKNLHIALLKLYHGLDFSAHCEEELFCRLLREFVATQCRYPEDFGFRRHREVINREMRSIIQKLRNHRLIQVVADEVPESWQGDWIDMVHTYVNAEIEAGFLAIYKEYAPAYDTCGAIGFRVPTPPRN